METTRSDARTNPPAAEPAKSGSPLRLLILLGVLVVALGALAYDHFVAKPGVEAAYNELQQLMLDQNAAAAVDSRRLTSEEVQKEIGKAPTKKIVDEDFTVEYYCWWGPVPFLNTYRQYLTAVFVGDEPRRLNSVYLNEYPPPEELSPRFWKSTEPPPGLEGPPGEEGMDSGAEGDPAAAGQGGKKGKKGKKSAEESGAETPEADTPANDGAPADAPAAADPPGDDKPAGEPPAEEKASSDAEENP